MVFDAIATVFRFAAAAGILGGALEAHRVTPPGAVNDYFLGFFVCFAFYMLPRRS